jgi:hypothetical protein
MKPKKIDYVKKENENDEKATNLQELSLTEQLELFADIIIDIYIESKYEKENKLNQQS